MSQKPFRTLIIWTIWFATVIVAILTLYRDTDVWEFVSHDPSRVTWLEIGVFILGLVASFVLTLLLTFEHIESMRYETMVRERGLGGVANYEGPRAVPRFFSGLKSAAEFNTKPDVDNLLDVELAVYHRISHTIDVIGNILITLGLIGTVMGLTVIMTGLTGSLQALGEDQEMLLSGLREAMSGMGTAFYTTLLGAVLGGVLLRVFAQITEHGVDGLRDAIMRTVLVFCARELEPSADRELKNLNREIEGLEQTVRGLGSVLDNSRSAVAQFSDEVARLKELSRAQSDLLIEQIRRHKYWCELLREEMRVLNKVSTPWWRRWLGLGRFVGSGERL